MLLEYAVEEGGLWQPLEIDLSEGEVVAQLQLFNHLGDENVQAVRFPDGKIWDSLLCGFATIEE